MTHLEYLQQESTHPVGKPRQEALRAFLEKGFPTTRHEDWKYTDLKPLTTRAFPILKGTPKATDLPVFDTYSPNYGVLLNGEIQESSLVDIAPLSNTKTDSAMDSPALTYLNDAFWTAGFEIKLTRVFQEPLVLWHVYRESKAHATYTRNVVAAAKNSQACIVEIFDSATQSEQDYANHVTQLLLEDNANVTHILIDRTGQSHIATRKLEAILGRDAQLTSIVVSLSTGLSRLDFEAKLEGEGARCSSYALALPEGQQHVDVHSNIFHKAPHTTSNQLVKNVVGDAGRSIFSGTIHVDKGAQKIEAHQLNRNLLLSAKAKADSLPRLIIHADDVQCSHGSSTGRIDENELFYLRSRGYTKSQAVAALVEAFSTEVVMHVPVEKLKTELGQHLQQRVEKL